MKRLTMATEPAFLFLVARQNLQAAKRAEVEGEEYFDVAPLANLRCGARAKVYFETEENPIVLLDPGPHKGKAGRIAHEILGVPARERPDIETEEGVLAFSPEEAP